MRWSSDIALKCTVFGSELPKMPWPPPGPCRCQNLDLVVERVEEAEAIGALVHPGDEVAAGADLRHERAGRHLGGPDGRRLLAVGSHAVAARALTAVARGRRMAGGWPGSAAAATAPSARPDAAITTNSVRRQGTPGRGRAFTGTPRGGGSGPGAAGHHHQRRHDHTHGEPVNASRPLRALAAKTA